MALDYEANVHLVYFSEKLRKNCLLQRNIAAIFSLSKYMVGIHTYTSNLPLNRGKFSEKNHFIRLWKKRCTNIVLFVSLRGGRHISMVLFMETCNQTCFSILWLTLITKKIVGLTLMTWKTLGHNFKFCVGLGNNLITFMPPSVNWVKANKNHTHILFTMSVVGYLVSDMLNNEEKSFWLISLHQNQNNLLKSLYFFENKMFLV